MAAAEPVQQQNEGPALIRGIWAAISIAVMIVILRVYAKIKIHQFRVDDILMITATVCLCFSCLATCVLSLVS